MEKVHGSLILVYPGTRVIVSLEDCEYLRNLSSWHLSPKGYVISGIKDEKGNHLYLHVIAAERMGLDCSNYIDHEDRNKLNSRRTNLRVATHSQNRANSNLNSNNNSGYKGVHFKKGKWYAQINIKGTKFPLDIIVHQSLHMLLT